MDSKLKKSWTFTAGALALLSSAAVSADDMQLRNLENRVNCLEQARCCNGMVNPPVNPPVCDGVNLFITADALWWTAKEGGLAYAYTDSTSSTNIFSANLKSPSMDWEWGFRVGVGYNMCHDNWDIYLNWTRFHHTTSHTETAGTGETLFPILMGFSTTNTTRNITSASGSWKLDFDTLDLELGRQFYVSKYLTLRPHAGLRGAIIDQKMHDNYTGGVFGSSIEAVRFKNNFHGAGIRAGIDTQWSFGCGWSLFGDAAISLLYGKFDIKEREYLQTSATTSIISMFFEDDYHLGRAATDLELGIRWENYFCCDQYRLIIQLGWEQHQFFGQNMISREASAIGKNIQYNHDLTLQGLTLELRFDF